MDLSLSFTCFLALLVETSSLYNSYGWWIPIRHHVVTYKEYQTDFERSYFYEQGRRLIDSHNCDEGISLLRTGVDLAPKDAAARNNLAGHAISILARLIYRCRLWGFSDVGIMHWHWKWLHRLCNLLVSKATVWFGTRTRMCV
eukprot:m.164014 g.164014  ORF g.164014 m.164014 type:complete len:143 (+) comp15224_c0_seq3:1219-1647(+)